MLGEIKRQLAQDISSTIECSADQLESLMELPKQLDHGTLALPVFFLAKERRQAPPAIAKELAEKLNRETVPNLEKVEPVGGYLNFHMQPEFLQNVLLKEVYHKPEGIGYGSVGEGKRAVIDFSSPNVAKPMNIGHLRATVIGQAICNLAKTQGYQVTGLNHLGDWGVQFGKLAWAYQNWGEEYPFAEKPFESLFQIYVRFHDEAEKNPELNAQGSLVFKKLEEGDPEVTKIWKMFVEISLKEYQRLWDLLGVKHDLVRGESFYNDRLKKVEDEIEAKGLLTESEGAMVVDLESDGMPPCLIRKSDGASLYATRDIASALYRKQELKADINLYVVGVDQTLHFKQVFRVLDKMGFEWSKDCHHISFGMYRFKDIGRMSTRKGNVIFLEDVLKKAVDSVKEIIEKKNPDLPDKSKVAEQVGVGAVIFNDLLNDRVKNVDFDWEKALDFEGDSGPYVQYCQVRCRSILSKFGQEVRKEFSGVLKEKAERQLVRDLLNYDQTLLNAFKHFKPHILATYLLDLCRSFGHFYHSCRIVGAPEELAHNRALLVHMTMIVLQQGLAVLNIESPEAM